MRALALLSVLVGVSSALTTTSKIQKLAQTLSQAQQSGNHTCQTAINRIKFPAVDYRTILGSGILFTDEQFNFNNDTSYWTDYNLGSLQLKYNKSYFWERASIRFPNSTLFGSGPNPYGVD
jgi:hypothetical protein